MINESSEKIKDFLIELSETLLDYYDSIKLSSELSIFQKIESFYIFYLITILSKRNILLYTQDKLNRIEVIL